MTALEIKLAIGAGILAISVAAFAWYHHHVILEGEAKIEASDSKAQAAATKQAEAETALNLANANKADEVAASAQKSVDDYRAAHPEQPIRLCHTNNSLASVPKVSPSNGSTSSTSPGSAPLPAVLGGNQSTPGPDISTDIDALVQAAGRLAVIDSDRQKR